MVSFAKGFDVLGVARSVMSSPQNVSSEEERISSEIACLSCTSLHRMASFMRSNLTDSRT